MVAFSFRVANESDVYRFLGRAIRDAERAHTGTGIWDVAIGEHSDPDKSLEAVLADACMYDTNSHFYYKNFIVAVSNGEETIGRREEIMAAGCAYYYPQCSVTKSYPGMSSSARKLRGISEEESITMWEKIAFLDVVFPDYNYNDTWLLEAIFVAPEYRKAGVALEMINRLYEEGRKSGARECLVVCGIGNAAAYRTYEKAGFEYVGKGESDIAQAAMGYAGFHLFSRKY